MPDYKLLTPGPLTTTDTVKREMLFDHCTWDDDYKKITQKIHRALLGLAKVSEKEYTAVLMQGSGTFGVESVITSAVGPEDRLLVAANGAYGERMADIAAMRVSITWCAGKITTGFRMRKESRNIWTKILPSPTYLWFTARRLPGSSTT